MQLILSRPYGLTAAHVSDIVKVDPKDATNYIDLILLCGLLRSQIATSINLPTY